MANKENIDIRERIHYVEPNQIINDQTSNLRGGYTAPLEDYGHSVDLEIIYSSRDSCGLGNNRSATYHLVNQKVSMMNGTSGNLTTNYTDVDMASPDNNTNECLGIQSIDIEYNGDSSYQSFMPMVSIVFVDTRGISLMNKEENGTGSVFNSLFSYPFPIFKLKVKGYYGGEVCYTLKPHKYASVEFEASTGNAIIRADFIGYMGGIYNDIPLQYLVVAPFMDYFGNAHWNKSVEDKHFAFEGGSNTTSPMISLPEFRRRVARVEESQEYKDAKTSHEKKEEEITKEQDETKLFKSAFPFVRDNTWKDFNKEGFYFKIDDSDAKKLKRKVNSDFDTYKKALKKNKKGSHYEEISKLIEFMNKDNIKCIRVQKKDNVFSPIKGTFDDYSNYFSDKYRFIRESIEEYNKTTFTVCFVEHPMGSKTILEQINEIIDKVDKKKEEETIRYYRQKEKAFEEALGFSPTIKNIYNLLFAHMETFMVSFYHCLKNIKDNLDGTNGGEQEKRSPQYIGITPEDTDMSDAVKLLPPFPIFTEKKEKGKDQYTETVWPSDIGKGDEMEEVSFVESLLRAARLYDEEQLDIDISLAKSKLEEKKKNKEKNVEEEENRLKELTDAYENSTSVPITKDMKLNTYLLLKELYDRWICTSDRNRWIINGENSDFDRFVYLDTFYNDMGHKIIVDPEEFAKFIDYQLPTGNSSIYAQNHSAFDFLYTCANECGGTLMDVPLLYGIEDDNRLAEIFEVIPTIKSDTSDKEKFVFLYTYKPSEHLAVNDGYEDDSFMVTDDLLPSALYDVSNKDSIPAFGVTFARQNQGIFKNISVESNNPNMTDAVIAKTMDIASQEGRGPRETAFYGQDIYSALSSAQYRSEVTMMGDAQIMPLMYYQLNNIPFWKGTYMLNKVHHSITPGNMETTFSGLRVNKNSLPLNGGNLPIIKNPGEMLIKINNKQVKVDMENENKVDMKDVTVDLNADFEINSAHTSTHWTSKRTLPIKYIVIHYTAGYSSKTGRAVRVADGFEKSSRAASADFIVDDGTIVQYNPDPLKYYTYAVGGKKLKTQGGTLNGIAKNSNTVSIEICSNYPGNPKVYPNANDSGWYFTNESVANAIKLTKFLMKKYNIDKDHVIRHYDVTGKFCPGITGWNKETGSEEKWLWFKKQL